MTGPDGLQLGRKIMWLYECFGFPSQHELYSIDCTYVEYYRVSQTFVDMARLHQAKLARETNQGAMEGELMVWTTCENCLVFLLILIALHTTLICPILPGRTKTGCHRCVDPDLWGEKWDLGQWTMELHATQTLHDYTTWPLNSAMSRVFSV